LSKIRLTQLNGQRRIQKMKTKEFSGKKNKQMKKILSLQTLAACALLAVSTSVRANTYDFTFTEFGGGPVDATGVIDVTAGVATGGSITVVGSGSINDGIYNLEPGTWFASPLVAFNADNSVFVGSATVLDSYGLLFGNASTEINLWGNSPNNYSLYGWNVATGYVPAVNGTLNGVPDGGMTFGLLGGALVGLQALRRKLSR
jgi:hypothetical protein